MEKYAFIGNIVINIFKIIVQFALVKMKFFGIFCNPPQDIGNLNFSIANFKICAKIKCIHICVEFTDGNDSKM